MNIIIKIIGYIILSIIIYYIVSAIYLHFYETVNYRFDMDEEMKKAKKNKINRL